MISSIVDRACRAIVFAAFRRVTGGEIVVVEPDGSRLRFGTLVPDRYGRPLLRATVHIHDGRTYAALVREGSVGLGESFADGWWSCDDLTGLLRLLARSLDRDSGRDELARWGRALRDATRRHRPDHQRDRDNVALHYDLGNELFSRFLDPTMTYSAGLFTAPGDSLLDASISKIDRLCEELDLGPGDRVLEIGTGWGSFALHAAGRYGCHVTTTTTSREQWRFARERVADARLTDLVDVRNDDYRHVRGTYDKLVSIEMIEAVDWRELDRFFKICTDRLAPDGLMGLQAIVISGPRWHRARSSTDFVKAHIFPGGCLHSIESITQAMRRSTDLSMQWLDDFGLHYAETLRRWHANFAASEDELARLGYDARFRRLWEFYLCYSEAAFEERAVSVVQTVLTRPGHRPAEVWLDQGWDGAGGASASSKATSST
jgi:cyclopropane-fatty-acyl-phospholipid synthase